MVMYIKTCSRSTPPVQLCILEEYVTAEWYVYVEHFCDHLLFVRMDTDQEQTPPAAETSVDAAETSVDAAETSVDASTGSNQAGAGAGSSSSSSLGKNHNRRTGWKGAAAARGGAARGGRRRNYNP